MTMTEQALRAWMMERRLSIKEGTTTERIDAVAKVIRNVLPRKSVSDRTCHRRVIEWIEKKIESGQWTAVELLPRLVDAVLEASGPTIRNPNAVFMVILKKELRYPN